MAGEEHEATEPDPITQLFPIGVTAYAWPQFGFWIGVLVGLSYVALVIVLNIFYMAKYMEHSTDPIKGLQRIKWVTFGFFMIGLAVAGLETCSGPDICQSVWE